MKSTKIFHNSTRKCITMKTKRNNTVRYLKKIKEIFKLLKISFGVQIKRYFQQSTLHGVRYVADNQRPFFERFLWFVCVMVGIVSTVVIILDLLDKFQTNPTITGLDTDFHSWDVPFPAVTLCQEQPANLTAIDEYLAENSIAETNSSHQFFTDLILLSYKKLFNIVENKEMIAKLKNVHLKKLILQLAYKCDDLFAKCDFKGDPIDCCKHFHPVFTEIGFCYTFNSRHFEKDLESVEDWQNFEISYIKETDSKWSLSFDMKITDSKISIFILNSDEIAGIDLQPQYTWNYLLNAMYFSVKQTYTTEDTRQLSIKQRRCIFRNEVRLKIDTYYTYTGCTRQCRMDNAMKLCNCIPAFYPEKLPEYKHCKMDELICIANNFMQIDAIEHCNCELGCSNTVYELEKLTDEQNKKGRMVVQFYSWPMIRYKREVLFGWVDLLVSFGGIAGLFLGFSLLSGVEIIYYLTLRCFCMLFQERDELEKIQYEERHKSLYDYDMGLIPSFIRKPYTGNGLMLVAKSYYGNKVWPRYRGKGLRTTVLPPFGIEFLN